MQSPTNLSTHQPDYAARQTKLTQLPCDVVALVPGASLKYFTGLDFHLSERPIIVFFGDFGAAAIVPELEQSRITARADLTMTCFPWRDEQGYQGAFQAAVDKLGLAWGRWHDHARHGIPRATTCCS